MVQLEDYKNDWLYVSLYALLYEASPINIFALPTNGSTFFNETGFWCVCFVFCLHPFPSVSFSSWRCWIWRQFGMQFLDVILMFLGNEVKCLQMHKKCSFPEVCEYLLKNVRKMRFTYFLPSTFCVLLTFFHPVYQPLSCRVMFW